MEKNWLKSYPAGVPSEINPDQYTSLVEMFEETVGKYGDKTAFINLMTPMSYREMVLAHAKLLRDNPDASVILQGNTDDRGSREYNLALGQRRADGVRNMMALAGAGDGQIEAVSFGEEKPRALGSGESAWSQNRRTDIVYRGE